MTELEREEVAERRRERSHGTKRLLMGAFLAVLIAGGAYVMFNSSKPADVAQNDITMPAPMINPSTLPTSPPPIPLPDATPMPKAEDAGQPVSMPETTAPAAPITVPVP